VPHSAGSDEGVHHKTFTDVRRSAGSHFLYSVVEIESEWTAQRRERMGIVPRVKIHQVVQNVPTLSPKAGDKGGAPLFRRRPRQ
jgi:hypothetical protein